ncbi:hypothetical protein TCAL_11210 [Tigriopus californicus]|uniref:Uncharacterized protein n=2 Tax=Tigriopus californicus TaxID=6832 RepID=A0A553PB01_TIGCA|nr:hypothetical protein TCAL_11210 [Tigriopus californicus]|eukprot:TCALIF_11210-PA protein Name:"Protein of unknown function" AED:0.79 eAED:0.79 QI:0/0.5/0.33/0.66/1/0.66/3/0/259
MSNREMDVLAELVRKLMDVQAESQALDEEIMALSESEEYKESRKNERDIRGPVSRDLKADVDLASGMVYHLKKSVPEGHLEDELLHKYLGIANLTESVEDLEERKVRAEKYVQYLEEKRQYNENMAVEIANQRECLKNTQGPRKSQAPNGNERKIELKTRIRSTIKSYKTIKTFLGELLVQISPERVEGEGALLAHLLQALWTLFFSSSGPYAYLCLSTFSQRVDPRDVALLVDNEIAERDPEDPDRVRLNNFLDEQED